MKQKTLQQVQEQTKGLELVVKSNEDYSKAEPITTSDRIALFCGYSQHTVDVLIKNNLESFKLVGKHTCPNLKLDQVLRTDKNGVQQHRQITYYILDEQQAYFLMTLMKNNEVVIKFKAKLVNDFFTMKNELLRRNETRQLGIKFFRRPLTDMIQIMNVNEPIDNFIKFSYKYYTDLVYKKLFNKTSAQIRKEKDLDVKKNLRDYFTIEELKQIQDLEDEVRRKCIKEGWVKLKPNIAYQKVKEFLQIN